MKKYTIIFLILVLYACNGQNNGNFKKNDEFGIKYTIPDSIYSFFPTNLSADWLSTNAKVNTSGIPLLPDKFIVNFIVKRYKFNDKDLYNSLIISHKEHSLYFTFSESDDYAIIEGERDLRKQIGDSLLKANYSNLLEKKLIMGFSVIFDREPEFYSYKNKCGLPDGYEILVLKSGNKFILPEIEKIDWEVLPERLKHGYLSGIAFKESEPYIIYWVVAW